MCKEQGHWKETCLLLLPNAAPHIVRSLDTDRHVVATSEEVEDPHDSPDQDGCNDYSSDDLDGWNYNDAPAEPSMPSIETARDY